MRTRVAQYIRVIIGSCLLLGAYLVGFVSSDQALFPSQHILRIKEQAKRLQARLRHAETDGAAIETSLLRLAVSSVQVPGAENREGGGITLAEDALLGVTGSGEFFLVAQEQLQMLDIIPPPQYYDEYVAASATPELASLIHDPSKLRYHSPLFIKREGKGILFLAYTEWQPEKRCYNFAIARLDVGSDASLQSMHVENQDWRIIFRAQPCLKLLKNDRALQGHISGGAMLFDEAEDRLLVSVGDYHFDGVHAPEIIAQDDHYQYGKLFSLSIDGTDVTQIASGLRNVQSMLQMPDGTIWATDHGPQGGDELNNIKRGDNYGWPYRTLGSRYNGLPWPLTDNYGRHESDEKYHGPVYAWVPSVGLSALIHIQNFDPAWDGDFLAASMGGQSLFRIRMTEGRVQYAEPILVRERIRQLRQLPDGSIVAWTGSRKVMTFTRASASRTLLAAEAATHAITGDSKKALGLMVVLQNCLECHSLDQGVQGRPPHLAGIVGRNVASTGYDSYSSALRAMGGRWTPERLADFLSDPQGFAPGTSMPSPQLPPETVDDLVRVLQEVSRAY